MEQINYEGIHEFEEIKMKESHLFLGFLVTVPIWLDIHDLRPTTNGLNSVRRNLAFGLTTGKDQSTYTKWVISSRIASVVGNGLFEHEGQFGDDVVRILYVD